MTGGLRLSGESSVDLSSIESTFVCPWAIAYRRLPRILRRFGIQSWHASFIEFIPKIVHASFIGFVVIIVHVFVFGFIECLVHVPVLGFMLDLVQVLSFGLIFGVVRAFTIGFYLYSSSHIYNWCSYLISPRFAIWF